MTHKKAIAVVSVVSGPILAALSKTANNSSGSEPTDSQNDNTYPSDDFNESYSEERVEDTFNSEDNNKDGIKGTPKSPHDRKGYWGDRWKKDENGNWYKSPSYTNPTKVHPKQMDDESEDE